MSKNKGLTESQLAGIAKRAVDDAVDFDSSDLSMKRTRALEYYRGEMNDIEAETGRSSVTSHDISDAVGWLLPQMVRLFCGTDVIVQYIPRRPKDEGFAEQATEYINYLAFNECNIEKVLQDNFWEGFVFGNGIGKVWWDSEEEYETEEYSGILDDVFNMMAQEDDVDVLQHEQREEEIDGPEGPMTVIVHDFVTRRPCSKGKIRIMAMPPEEYLIERGAKSIEEANFHCHRYTASRADLIARGYDKKKVMALPAMTRGQEEDGPYNARWQHLADWDSAVDQDIMEEVQVYECYLRVDYDGDDHAEWRKIVLGSNNSSEECILENVDWADPIPFYDICPDPNPHRWDGRSVYDSLVDVQRVKTVLMRQTLDNIYLQNRPMMGVMLNSIDNMDGLVNPAIGQIILKKSPDAVQPIVTPFVADASFQMLSYLDDIQQRRTGVSSTSMSLDPESLQYQTATANQQGQTSAYAKTELYARNISRGVRDLFVKLLRLVTKHQDIPATFRLRDEWVQVNPTKWPSTMDVSVSVGLGSGSRERDMMILQMIAAAQKEVIQHAGPTNPIAGVDRLVQTYRMAVNAAGFKNVNTFFGKVDERQVGQWMKENPQKEDPKIQIEKLKLQGSMQIEQMKAKAQMDREQAQFQADVMVQQQQMQIEERKAEIDIQMKLMDLEIKKQELALKEREMQMKLQTAQIDQQIKREGAAMQVEAQREQHMMKREQMVDQHEFAREKMDMQRQQMAQKKDAGDGDDA